MLLLIQVAVVDLQRAYKQIFLFNFKVRTLLNSDQNKIYNKYNDFVERIVVVAFFWSIHLN